MNDVQKYLLKLVEEIDQICTKHDIEYYIFAGSMLGVERNKGFLPWDDDIDIVMTRSNYKKFKAVIADELKPNRAFEERDTHDEYPLPFGKYTSKDTANMIKSLTYGDCAAGFWIDIMHLAPMPIEERKRKWVKNIFPVYCELDNEFYSGYQYRWYGFYKLYKLLSIVSKIVGKKRVLNFIKKKLDAIPEEGCKDYYLFHALDADFRIFSKKCFDHPVRMKYEDIMVNVSPENRTLCREAYGDSWMMVPNIDNQIVHETITDCDRPFTVYKRDIMQFLDSKKVIETYNITKQAHIKWCRNNRALVESNLLLESELVAMETEEIISKHSVSMDTLIEQKRYKEIGMLFEKYIAFQWSENIKNNNIFVPISDSSLRGLLLYLTIEKQEFYSANKLLQLRKKTGRYDVEYFKDIELLIQQLRSLSITLWDEQDHDEVYNICCENKHVWQEYKIKDFCHAFCISGYITGREKAEDIIQLCDRLIDDGDKSGIPQKILGDIYQDCGDTTEALKWYKAAAGLLRNGLLLLDVNNVIKGL